MISTEMAEWRSAWRGALVTQTTLSNNAEGAPLLAAAQPCSKSFWNSNHGSVTWLVLTWLECVRPDAAVDEAAAVLEDARLRRVEARRRVRPQPLPVRGRAREDLRRRETNS